MKKLLLITLILCAGFLTQAQNNVPICAIDTTIRTNGDTVFNEVLPLVMRIDNKNFAIGTVARVRVVSSISGESEILTNLVVKDYHPYNLDSSYYVFHNDIWQWFTGQQIQNAVAPVNTNMLISLGRNAFYRTRQDSLFIPRTY